MSKSVNQQGSEREKQRITSIVGIVSEGVSCDENFPPDEWKDEFEPAVARMMVVLGLTTKTPVEPDYIYEFCGWFPDPKTLFAGLYFLSGSCLDSGSEWDCPGCDVEQYCPSAFDPDNRPEECGE